MGLGGDLGGGVMICRVTGVQRLSVRGVMRVGVMRVEVIYVRGVKRREVERIETRERE